MKIATLIALNIALAAGVAFTGIAVATHEPTVTVSYPDGFFVVKPECADVMLASGATSVWDIHRDVSETPAYVEACF